MPTIRVTLTDPALASRAAADGAHGVGLAAVEGSVLATGIHPQRLLEERGATAYAALLSGPILTICEAFAGYPVWVRMLDWRDSTRAALPGGGTAATRNPTLGWRGIRHDLARPDHHAAQWLAFRQVFEAGCENLGVLVPGVHDVEQLRAVQRMREDAGLEDVCAVGLLVETPAAALCIESFLEAGVDAVTFCADQLAELTVGIDPAHPELGAQCDPGHPAVVRLIGGAAAVCASAGVETTACATRPLDPALFVRYLSLGIEAISCAPEALARVRAATAAEPWAADEFRAWKPGDRETT